MILRYHLSLVRVQGFTAVSGYVIRSRESIHYSAAKTGIFSTGRIASSQPQPILLPNQFKAIPLPMPFHSPNPPSINCSHTLSPQSRNFTFFRCRQIFGHSKHPATHTHRIALCILTPPVVPNATYCPSLNCSYSSSRLAKKNALSRPTV